MKRFVTKKYDSELKRDDQMSQSKNREKNQTSGTDVSGNTMSGITKKPYVGKSLAIGKNYEDVK